MNEIATARELELLRKIEALVIERHRLTAEVERLRTGISSFVAAWDSLPVGDHSVRVVQDWLNSPALESSVLGLKAFQQTTTNSGDLKNG